jgi:hypothetical protein
MLLIKGILFFFKVEIQKNLFDSPHFFMSDPRIDRTHFKITCTFNTFHRPHFKIRPGLLTNHFEPVYCQI